MSALRSVADEAKVSHRWLHRMLSEASSIPFDRADRLLCAMGLVQLWQAEPLAEWYMKVDLSDPEPAEEAPPPVITEGETFPCGHLRTLENCKPDNSCNKRGSSYWRCRECYNQRNRARRAAIRAAA